MKHTFSYNKFSSIFFRRAFKFMLLHFSRQFFVPPSFRPFILKHCGVVFQDSKSVFIGVDVLFDNLRNTKTTIGKNVTITTGVKILNHFPIISENGVSEYDLGDIIIKDNVFIGMNSLIVKPVIIGEGAIIAAGSVIIGDVEEYTLVGGNPAKKIKTLPTSL